MCHAPVEGNTRNTGMELITCYHSVLSADKQNNALVTIFLYDLRDKIEVQVRSIEIANTQFEV